MVAHLINPRLGTFRLPVRTPPPAFQASGTSLVPSNLILVKRPPAGGDSEGLASDSIGQEVSRVEYGAASRPMTAWCATFVLSLIALAWAGGMACAAGYYCLTCARQSGSPRPMRWRPSRQTRDDGATPTRRREREGRDHRRGYRDRRAVGTVSVAAAVLRDAALAAREAWCSVEATRPKSQRN